MDNNKLPEGYEPPTPGLSKAWRFWRNIEQQNLTAAESNASVLGESNQFDAATKNMIEAALEDLRKKKSVEAPPPAATVGLPVTASIPVSTKHRINRYAESGTEGQVHMLDSILQALRNDDVNAALDTFKRIPFPGDRAKILCSLLPMKIAFSITDWIAAHGMEAGRRDSISSLYRGDVEKRNLVTKQFLKAYFALLRN
jgi:hypothetical protein